MSTKTTITKIAKLLAIMFGCAIVLSVGFIWLFTSGVMDVDGTPDKHIDAAEIGEIRNFTAKKCIALTIYEISGTIEYEGNNNYYIHAGGYNKDGDLYLIVSGSTGDYVVTDVQNGYGSREFDRDYTDLAEDWFESGV